MVFTVSGPFKNLPTGLEIPDQRLVILTGPNNSGKSAILQWLNIWSPIAPQSDYVSPRRFELSNEVAIALNSDQEILNLFNQRKQWNESLAELAAPDPIRELVHFSNDVRDRVANWHNRYFGQLKIEKLHPENDFSPPRITIDGRLATQQGSGSRAVLSVLVALLSPRSETILIDEPEIGIEPQVQRKLAELIRAIASGEGDVPTKRVYLATHSHLFLDREQVQNNFTVTKDRAGNAQIRQVESDAGLQQLVFALLGNTPSDLFFPDNVLVVEGPSDQIFWRRVLELLGYPGIAVHFGDGDGTIRAALPAIEQMLKTQVYIPVWYRERICVGVDADVTDARLNEWRAFLGDDGTRVRRLSHAGIEHFYPRTVLAQISGLADADLDPGLAGFLAAVRAGARTAALGAFQSSKRELATTVANAMTTAHLDELSDEIKSLANQVRELSFSETGFDGLDSEAAKDQRADK